MVTTADLQLALAAFRREAVPGTLDTGRYRMRYFTWGEGPPLVFVHGMADIARSFAMVMQPLVNRFTCIAYELPNGVNDGSALGRYRLADYAADLVALLDHLDLDRVAVLGSSFGSIITLTALTRTPQRFTKAILQGGFARRPLGRAEFRLAQLGRFWPWWFGDWPVIRRTVMGRLDRPAFATAPPAVYEFFLANSERTPCRAAARRSLTIARTDLRSVLPGIRTPILMIGGDRDAIVPRIYEQEVEAGLPDVRRVEFAPCGHYPQYIHPGPMAGAIDRYLLPEPVVLV